METYRLLIIEGSKSDFDLLERHFAAQTGFYVTLSRIKDTTAFEEALTHHWDAILAEYDVPGFGALPALKILQDRGINIPVIILSGQAGEEKAIETMHAGADDFIRKDNLSRLAPALQRSIRVSRMRRRKLELRKEHERALHDREHLLDVVCHDLKNPMSSIRLNCQLLLFKTKAPQLLDNRWIAEIAENMLRCTDRIDRLVTNLLEQSRMEAGLLSIHARRTGIKTFLDEVFHAFEPMAKNKGILLQIENENPNSEGIFDRDRAFQVISNLLSNAMRFSAAGTIVTFGTNTTETGNLFFVRDAGQGISEDVKQSLLKPTRQRKPRNAKGNGLGLWSAREIIKAHGGEFGFHPVADGPGTVFWFSIPNLHKDNAASMPSPNTQVDRPARVVIVDDDEDLAAAICRVLHTHRIPCIAVNDYDAAVSCFESDQWTSRDIVLIDYDLTGKNGGELIQWMRGRFNDETCPRIVLMSAHPDIGERLLHLKVSETLRKPINLNDLVEIVSTP